MNGDEYKGPLKYFVIKGGWSKPNDYLITIIIELVRFDYSVDGVLKGQKS